jgi:D-glycero-alpha-D-manno-heptose 1-phosphate guanylyltransferase
LIVTDTLHHVQAAILAGGLGTRLRSAVPGRPKVLAPVGGRPYLTYVLDQLAEAGVRDAVLLTGYRADEVRATLGTEHAGLRLTYSVEHTPLGTAGAVRQALPLLSSPTVLLLNGDSFCDVDFHAFWEFHGQTNGGASLVLARVADVSRFGQAFPEADGRILRFAEKGMGRVAGWINAGIYLLDRALLGTLPADTPLSLERDLLPKWVGGGRVHGFPGAGRFLDIGTPESYARAGSFFLPAGQPVGG